MFQAINAARIFVVLSRAETSEINRLRAIMSNYGRETEHFVDPLRIGVIEYQC
jgi:hypothetical protein